MKTRQFFLYSWLLLFVFGAAIFSVASAQRAADNTFVNLALAAKASSSYVSRSAPGCTK